MAERIAIEHLLSRGRPADFPVAFREGQVLTFADFEARAAGWRAAYERHGGHRFALSFEDTFEFAAALLGAWHAGRCVYLPSEIQPTTREKLRGEVDGFAGQIPSSTPLLKFQEGARAEWTPLSPEAQALVVYTSGSSGEPAAIPKHLGQLTREVATLADLFDDRLGPSPCRVLATVSHQHIYGLLFRVLWPLTSGRPFLARSLPYPEDIVAELSHGPAALIASPAHLKRLPDTLDWAGVRGNLRSVFSSGGPLSTDALHACRGLLGQAPVEVYGSSETGGIAWRQRTQDEALSWRTMPGVEVRLTEDALAVRSPHLPDGNWFQTEDRARLLPEGFELLGRMDRLLKLEEKRVSLSAMERALLESDLVREARVVPLSEGNRSVLGVVAVLGPTGRHLHADSGKPFLNRALRKHLSSQFEPSVLPRRFRYLEAMPVNSQGKSTEAALVALFDSRRPPLRVLEHTADRAVLSIETPASLPYFKGHFPEKAILPGVAQIEWALHLGRELFTLPPEFLRMEAVKFQQLIVPETLLTLELTWTQAKGSLQFKFTSEAGTHGSGRILLGEVRG
ncbi:AMP-binding protein [Myxococcus llanfairpwllgwyngyllgogerychwyrndrobwllllantysiliogogogochensis]|uniref:AMP-binding protein n=1 Tax=Myxococcus llanfairpwllgwyngyllgogerychwyrndrobwllllantysiliogogogochensis TaxID=2590453 RepID=A0A540X882_9BACT|nr:AMP-binding protein [Myxococcus llanfairpwllgwyngyllgogerychwyrndrobwllllantysiliogogogochensis]TQF17432.1 AMP-binding protein [Myxococcus llanfairpwllgwyngyllgogerychwyrndrobwllllantysiliogogogochensis]